MSQGSIIKREGKRGVSYQIKWDGEPDPVTGKRKQNYKTFKTKAEAQKGLRKELGEKDNGTNVDPSKMTVGQWLRTWLDDHAHSKVSQSTWEGYDLIVTTQILPRLGSTLLQKLTSTAIQRMYTELLKSGHIVNCRRAAAAEEEPGDDCGLTGQTVLHIHRVLFQAFKKAMKLRHINRNPVEDVTAPKPEKTQASTMEEGDYGPIKALEKDELLTLFTSVRTKPIFPFVLVATGTGARRGELLALRWSDVDFDKKTLRINKALEKSAKFGLRVKAPKNKSSRRTISIDEGLCEALKRHRQYHEELASKLGVLCPNDGLVFPCVIRRARGKQPLTPIVRDVDFSRPWHPDAITKDFRRAADAAGFPDLRLHDLRHTHASQLLDANVPLHVVSQRLGHSTPVITMTIYAHVLKRADDKASQVSGDLLLGALGGAY